MSERHPECPLYSHDNCREIHNPKLCAIVREDKGCLKKKKDPKSKSKKKDGNDLGEWNVFGEAKENF